MSSPISAISGLSGVSGIEGIQAVDGLGATTGTNAVEAPNENFAGLLAKGLAGVQSAQTNADNLAVKVADGTLADPAQYTMAANEASLGLQLTLAIRNKALDAFQEIMRMQA
jgi:flagellar hook-basal body complex protein FliE